MKNPWIIIAGLTVALFGGAFWYSGVVNQQANEGVVVQPHVKGNPDATVVLEEFSDFQCPACAQFQPIVSEILADYGDQIRFEYRHFPLMQIHPYAEAAARAAEAAGQQGKFFEYHDYLFENQSRWGQARGNAPAFFVEAAEALELDMDQFTRQQRSAMLRDKVADDLREGLERGVNSTPTFFLNGTRMELRTIADLRAQIEASLGLTSESAEGATTTNATAEPATPGVQFGI